MVFSSFDVKPLILRQNHWLNPEFTEHPFSLDMDMHWLVAVEACRRRSGMVPECREPSAYHMSFRSIDECGATVHISCIGSLLRITGTGVSGVGSTYFFRVLMDAGGLRGHPLRPYARREPTFPTAIYSQVLPLRERYGGCFAGARQEKPAPQGPAATHCPAFGQPGYQRAGLNTGGELVIYFLVAVPFPRTGINA